MRWLAVLLLPVVAHAAPPGETDPIAPPASGEPAYHLQLVAVDAAAVAVAFASHGSRLDVAVLGYALGPAFVHAYHHHGSRAGASVALRVGLPLVAGFLGAELGHCDDPTGDNEVCDDREVVMAGLGVLAGMSAAMVIDDGFLGRADPGPSASWTPMVRADHGGMTLGIAGAF